MSSSIVSPWRGTSFPTNPIGGQLFFLDAANGADPPRGWYVFQTSISTRTATGEWTLTNRAVGDQGDLVRPIRDRDRRR